MYPIFPLESDANPAQVQALAAGLVAAEDRVGGRKATGSIVFAGNLTAGDTVTINGVTFTAVASDAGEGEFEVDVSLSATLDNLVAAIQGHSDPDGRLAQVEVAKNTGNDGLDFVAAEFGAAGNAITIEAEVDGTDPTVSGETLEGGYDEDKMTGRAAHVNLITVDGGNMIFNLPNGVHDGQERTIFFKTKGGSANAIVFGTFGGGNVKATFDAAGEFLHLKWMGGAWQVLVNGGSVSLASS